MCSGQEECPSCATNPNEVLPEIHRDVGYEDNFMSGFVWFFVILAMPFVYEITKFKAPVMVLFFFLPTAIITFCAIMSLRKMYHFTRYQKLMDLPREKRVKKIKRIKRIPLGMWKYKNFNTTLVNVTWFKVLTRVVTLFFSVRTLINLHIIFNMPK